MFFLFFWCLLWSKIMVKMKTFSIDHETLFNFVKRFSFFKTVNYFSSLSFSLSHTLSLAVHSSPLPEVASCHLCLWDFVGIYHQSLMDSIRAPPPEVVLSCWLPLEVTQSRQPPLEAIRVHKSSPSKISKGYWKLLIFRTSQTPKNDFVENIFQYKTFYVETSKALTTRQPVWVSWSIWTW
jgi:hypothetical protein